MNTTTQQLTTLSKLLAARDALQAQYAAGDYTKYRAVMLAEREVVAEYARIALPK